MHKAFGRGQIIELGDDVVTVLFAKANEKKKFIYPSSMQTFLMLEDAGAVRQFKEYSAEMASNSAAAQAEAAEKLALEKIAIQEHAKALKKAMKKPVKKAKKAKKAE